MFVGRQQCELPAMAVLDRRTDARHYLAVEVSLRLPWFVVNTVLVAERKRFLQTHCCAWERDVADLCMPSPNRQVASIQQMSPVTHPPGGWAIRQISKVWRARRPDGTEEVVLEDDEGEAFSGAFGAPPAADLSDRQLLFSADPPQKVADRRRRAVPGRPQVSLVDRPGDLMAELTAKQLGELLGGVDEHAVSELESRGELFSVATDGIGRYPAFQAWPTLPRHAIADVLKALRTYDTTVDAREFFWSLNPDLDMLGPVEVLVGALLRERAVHEDVPALLASSPEDRVRLVVAAAQAHAAALWGACRDKPSFLS